MITKFILCNLSGQSIRTIAQKQKNGRVIALGTEEDTIYTDTLKPSTTFGLAICESAWDTFERISIYELFKHVCVIGLLW